MTTTTRRMPPRRSWRRTWPMTGSPAKGESSFGCSGVSRAPGRAAAESTASSTPIEDLRRVRRCSGVVPAAMEPGASMGGEETWEAGLAAAVVLLHPSRGSARLAARAVTALAGEGLSSGVVGLDAVDCRPRAATTAASSFRTEWRRKALLRSYLQVIGCRPIASGSLDRAAQGVVV